jgi:hypothetical protein
MIYSYITTGTTTQVYSGQVKKFIIQVNAALTGTITLYDATSGTTGGFGIITNPTVGSSFEYWGIQNGVRIVTSTTCDITVSCDLSRSGV